MSTKLKWYKYLPVYLRPRRKLMHRMVKLKVRVEIAHCKACGHHRRNHWGRGCKRRQRCECHVMVR